MVEAPAQRWRRGCWWWLGALVLAGLALAQTWPLGQYLSRGIPYGYNVVPGFEQVPLVPGDHLQFYYWCWLLGDNLMGPSAWLTNPYEFSTHLVLGLTGHANFPFSLVFVLFSFLGPIGAYNALVVLSYVLAGLCAHALAREVLGSRLAALPAGLIYALLPFRAAQVLSGHLFGFVAFMLPLTLWCLERALRRRSWLWGLGAGVCLALTSLMEGHLIYYTCLLLGAYVPLRLLLGELPSRELGGGWAGWGLLVALAGAGAGTLAHLLLARQGGLAVWSPAWAQSAIIYLVLFLAAWLGLAWLAQTFTTLEPGPAHGAAARLFIPWLAGPLYGLHWLLDIPYWGKLLALAMLLGGLVWSLPALWRARRWPVPPRGVWPALALVLAGMLAAVGYMLYVKFSFFDASIAGQGRSLRDVLLFTPHLGDLVDHANVHMERLILMGWGLAGLAGLGLLMLALGFPRRASGGALAALWTGLGVLATLLCLGPTLPEAPLYELLYHYLPFFNFPRVPGRLILVAALLLSLAGGWALAQLCRGISSPGGRVVIGLILATLLTWDTWPPAQTGICLMPPAGKVEAAVRAQLPAGPGSGKRLLHLPIWPGDSHQSSIYEYMITGTQALTVNGYSPVVPRSYVEQVFTPLDPLNLGRVPPQSWAALDRLGVELVAFHDDFQVYTRKVSPFPAALARQRLLASGRFGLTAQEGNVFLFKRRAVTPIRDASRQVVSPVCSLWEAEWLKHTTGRLKEEKAASGWGLMFREAARLGGPLGPRYQHAQGNVVSARPGQDRPGFLSFGPYRAFPPGDYQARFRLRRGAGPAPGWVDVCAGGGKVVLARQELNDATLPPDGAWHDLVLEFSLPDAAVLETRTWYGGGGPLDLDLVLVSFAGRPPLGSFWPAADLWRQTGDLVADSRAPGGWAVLARAGYHPPVYPLHGPQQTVAPGRFQARFRLALGDKPPQGQTVLAHLVVATDLGRRPLAMRPVTAAELGSAYRDLVLEFSVERQCELDLRVKFTGGGDLRLAGVSLRKLP